MKLDDYVPGEDAARERSRLTTMIVTQVVPVGGILFVLLVVAGFLVAIAACRAPIEIGAAACAGELGAPATMLLVRLDACGAVVVVGGREGGFWLC